MRRSVTVSAIVARSLLISNRHKFAALAVAGLAANQVEIGNLVDAKRELTETVLTLQKDAFEYFKKLLSPALAMKWQLIVEEEVVGVDYVSLTGKKPGLARGRDFAALSP